MNDQRSLRAVTVATIGFLTGTGSPAFAGNCAGEIATAIDIGPAETVTLNCGGGPNDPMEEALVVFTNGPDSEPAAITICEVAENLHPGAPGYVAFDRMLTAEVTFEDNIPGNEDTFFMRILLPFDETDLVPGEYGPEATDVAFFRTSAWALAVTGNTVNSPDFAGTMGDRSTEVGTIPPTELSDEIGDYGVFWHTSELRGFAWANVDHAGDFAAGAPLCWSDVNGDGVVDALDVAAILTLLGQVCTDPPVGCFGDVFFDGVIDQRDVAQALAFWPSEACFLPPDIADVLHSVHQVDNTAGDEEWGAGSAFSTHLTWDLRVDVEPEGPGDSWTTSQVFARINDPAYGALTFYQHHFEAELGAPPTAGVCTFFPAAEFDSYYIEATDVSPCTIGGTLPGASNGFGYTQTGTELGAGWFDWARFDPPTIGDPPFTIARFTILVDVDDEDCPQCHLDIEIVGSGSAGADPLLGTIEGVTTHRYGLSRLVPFSYDIIDRCAADIDGDGLVGILDLLDLLAAWPAGFGTAADVDRDGTVGITDFLMVLGRWGPC